MNRKIITGCEYVADGRKGVSKLADRQNEPAWNLAQNIADMNRQDDFAYVIDICLSSGQLHLVEMNPFSGADLYLCDAEAIISAIEQG